MKHMSSVTGQNETHKQNSNLGWTDGHTDRQTDRHTEVHIEVLPT